jgi:hypothetical protein
MALVIFPQEKTVWKPMNILKNFLILYCDYSYLGN